MIPILVKFKLISLKALHFYRAINLANSCSFKVVDVANVSANVSLLALYKEKKIVAPSSHFHCLNAILPFSLPKCLSACLPCNSIFFES